MIEVEVKLPVTDSNALTDKLLAIGFTWFHCVRESDTYFDNAQQAIRQAGAALRVRTIKDLTTKTITTAITYKGKKLDHISMTRQELETTVSDGNTMTELFAQLGYFPAAPDVVKTRNEYIFDDMHACVDQVQGLGTFLELEVVVPSENEKDVALERIRTTLADLCYSIEQCTQNSYLSMLMHVQD